MAEKTHLFTILFVMTTWITCSSITQIANKNVISEGVPPLLLISSQMVTGSLFHLIITIFRRKDTSSSCVESYFSKICDLDPLCLIVGLTNALVHTLTYYSLTLISPALTHILRATEPIWMMIFSYTLFQIEASLQQIISVCLMIIGVGSIVLGGETELQIDQNAFLRGVAIVLSANMSIAARNCAVKKYTQISKKTLPYQAVCTYSLIFVLCPSILQWFYYNEMIKFSVNLVIASIFHIAYSCMSFYVLSLVDASSHSVIKLISRSVVVTSLTVVFGIKELSIYLMFGIMFCALGAFLYAMSMKTLTTWLRIPAFPTRRRFIFVTVASTVVFFVLQYLGQVSVIPTYMVSNNFTHFRSNQSISLQPNLSLQREKHTIDSNISQIQFEALKEVRLDRMNTLTFRYPIIPTGGYRGCLKLHRNTKRSNTVVSLGDVEKMCEDCSPIDHHRESFTSLSKLVCRSKALYCGIGSTFICGLLGTSTKTTTYVDTEELNTWPVYMRDLTYGKDHVHIIESNHRIIWERHTIKQTHPHLNHSNIARSENGFDLILFTFGSDCSKADRRLPLKKGNMGDIFGSHLAYYFSNLIKVPFISLCSYKDHHKNSGMNITFALVGSIARDAARLPNTVLLGVGTISKNNLQSIPYLQKGAHVLGVRGPKTRDDFLEKYGVNPEVVGDPGLYLYTIYKDRVDQIRKDETKLLDLCFISHEVDGPDFKLKVKSFLNVTISAGGYIDGIVLKMAKCKHIVSSSLHGVIFSHSLSIPAVPVKVSEKLAGGDWKFYDYYYGVNVTTFPGRIIIDKDRKKPHSKNDWIDLVKKFPQPRLPFNIEELRTFEIFKQLFRNDKRLLE